MLTAQKPSSGNVLLVSSGYKKAGSIVSMFRSIEFKLLLAVALILIRIASNTQMDTSEQSAHNDEKERRYDWEKNHQMIQDIIFQYIEDETLRRMPTYDELVEKTGLGLTTIRRHLKDLDMSRINQRTKALGEMVLMRQASRALTDGEAKDVALYFKLNYGWSERYGIEVKNVDEFSDEERRERIGKLLEKGGVPADIVTKLLRGTGVVSSTPGGDESLGDAGSAEEMAGGPGFILP